MGSWSRVRIFLTDIGISSPEARRTIPTTTPMQHRSSPSYTWMIGTFRLMEISLVTPLL